MFLFFKENMFSWNIFKWINMESNYCWNLDIFRDGYYIYRANLIPLQPNEPQPILTISGSLRPTRMPIKLVWKELHRHLLVCSASAHQIRKIHKPAVLLYLDQTRRLDQFLKNNSKDNVNDVSPTISCFTFPHLKTQPNQTWTE